MQGMDLSRARIVIRSSAPRLFLSAGDHRLGVGWGASGRKFGSNWSQETLRLWVETRSAQRPVQRGLGALPATVAGGLWVMDYLIFALLPAGGAIGFARVECRAGLVAADAVRGRALSRR